MQYESRPVEATYTDGRKGEVVLQFPIREKNRVYIIGTATTKDTVPWGDTDAEFWGVNNLYGVQLKNASGAMHYDRWFEIHNIWQDPTTNKMLRRGSEEFRGQNVLDYLKGIGSLNCTVYMQKHWPDLIPMSIQYPLEDVVNFFLAKGLNRQFCRYLTNTISLEIVLAMYLGFTDIRVWGVDMQAGCLTPETKVLTSDLRWVPSGDLEVGDEVMAFDEESPWPDGYRKWKTAKVTANPEIKRPCYRVSLEDGSEIIASAKHGWLTHGENHNRWKTTDQLVTRHHRTGRPTRIVKLMETWEPDNTWEGGYIAAAFDGEGHLSQQPKRDHVGSNAFVVGFAQRDNAMLDTVQRTLTSYGFDFGACCKENGGETGKYAIRGGKPELMRFLGKFRPKRLLPKFNPNVIGTIQAKNNVAVTGLDFIGDQTVMGLETDAKTYVAEGFASHNSEYGWQRPSCEFWLGFAAGMGVTIHIPEEADLLKAKFIYGFEEAQQHQFRDKLEKIRKDMKIKRLELQVKHAEDERNLQQLIGAEQVVSEIKNIWTNLEDDLILQKRGS